MFDFDGIYMTESWYIVNAPRFNNNKFTPEFSKAIILSLPIPYILRGCISHCTIYITTNVLV
jgi:hypothetical protein